MAPILKNKHIWTKTYTFTNPNGYYVYKCEVCRGSAKRYNRKPKKLKRDKDCDKYCWDEINRFEGIFRFLSNFYIVEINYEGLKYPSVEHAYHAAKTKSKKKRKVFASNSLSPAQAKKAGRKLKLRSDWDDVKLKIMYKLLKKKFKGGLFKKWLLNTGEIKLVEGNTWKDRYWGVYKGRGHNYLGRLLMKIRKRLKDEL